MTLRESLLRLLRVPPRPEPPPGSPPRVFRAAPNYLRLRLMVWLAGQLPAAAGIVWALWFLDAVVSSKAPQPVVWFLKAAEVFAIAAFVFQLLFGWIVVRVDFELRWYMLSDRAIRIREGVLTVREKTVALANVQNIALHEGPLQRWFGIADVEVKTAGGGDSGSSEERRHREEPMHIAWFRGVANAPEIRDLIREGVLRQRTSGLGDPDEHAHEVPPPAPAGTAGDDVREAAEVLLAEARRLRAAIA